MSLALSAVMKKWAHPIVAFSWFKWDTRPFHVPFTWDYIFLNCLWLFVLQVCPTTHLSDSELEIKDIAKKTHNFDLLIKQILVNATHEMLVIELTSNPLYFPSLSFMVNGGKMKPAPE